MAEEKVEKKSGGVQSLSDRALAVVNYTEQKFWDLGSLPSYEVIAAGVKEPVDYVRQVIEKNSLARKSLVVRGVDLSPSESAQLLTSEQLIAANLILNAHDKRSVREKLDQIGVSSQKWHAWLRQPGFSQYINKRAEAAFEANDHAAYAALQENVEEGRLDAVKFHFEMRGKYKQSLDLNINIEQVLTQVVEIVARHVNDQDTLIAIAEDMGQLQQRAVGELNSGQVA